MAFSVSGDGSVPLGSALASGVHCSAYTRGVLSLDVGGCDFDRSSRSAVSLSSLFRISLSLFALSLWEAFSFGRLFDEADVFLRFGEGVSPLPLIKVPKLDAAIS